MSGHKSFRPSNGTEGDIFMGQWCEHCSKHAPGDDVDCHILRDALATSMDDQHYPPEWIYRVGVPACTAFVRQSDPADVPVPRCENTPDMFGEVAS